MDDPPSYEASISEEQSDFVPFESESHALNGHEHTDFASFESTSHTLNEHDHESDFSAPETNIHSTKEHEPHNDFESKESTSHALNEHEKKKDFNLCELNSHELNEQEQQNEFSTCESIGHALNELESNTQPSAPPITSDETLTSPMNSKVPLTPSLPHTVPSAPFAPPSYQASQSIQPSFRSLTDETIRRTCYDFAENNYKNATSFIENMNFSNIRSCYSLHYKLETFVETREFVIKYGKCDGKPVDGSNNGPEPDLQSIVVVCKWKFRDGEEHVVIPHSEHLRNCRKCDDRGKEYCLVCKGAGWNPCSSCSGIGYLKDRSSCTTCSRSGRLICEPCYSSGRINCSVCDGYKKVKSYKELKVTWTNHVDEFVVNPEDDLPTNLLKKATSNEIFNEEGPRVQPITLFPDAAINIASLNLVFKHQKDCINKSVLLQRHSVRAVPVTKISYNCKGKTGDFFVYGNENCVYFGNFPEMLDRIS